MELTDKCFISDCSDTDSLRTENSFEDITPLEPGVYYPNKKVYRPKTCRAQSRRFVFKNGQFNIKKTKFSRRSSFSKWFIRMVEARWRWALLQFFMAFTSNWLTFGFIYWLFSWHHDDLREDHLPPNQNASNWTPCVNNIYGFTSCFLFSVEVHTTVAYGKRSITLECPGLITAMCFQCIMCQIFQAFMIGILFAKLTRPKSRTQTILFSKQAVITLRDGKFCLIFRVGDMRKSRILNIKTSVFVLKFGIETNSYEQIELKVEMDGCESTFFLWPVSITHVIDRKSPLYEVSAADLLLGKFEILAVFEGIIESTGQPVQARTSYTENDIFWGHRFLPMVHKDDIKRKYDVDFSKLSDTEKFDTPLCSPNELNSMTPLYELENCFPFYLKSEDRQS